MSTTDKPHAHSPLTQPALRANQHTQPAWPTHMAPHEFKKLPTRLPHDTTKYSHSLRHAPSYPQGLPPQGQKSARTTSKPGHYPRHNTENTIFPTIPNRHNKIEIDHTPVDLKPVPAKSNFSNHISLNPVPKADGSEHAREVFRLLEVTALVDAAHKAGQSLMPKPQSAGRTGAHLGSG
ncbi:hypothetical protein T492DRAFT_984172 [Pavlovales sp. CCMP2436]|nr:hypothetical protein T492DRAFT_984172 [Pavlovales sp. CCMP2436]